jgi:putative flippase GtrA
MLSAPAIKQFLKFALVGVIGFCVDASVLLLAVRWLPINLYEGRIISFLAAVTVTWILNRTFTFQRPKTQSYLMEWVRFASSNAVGGLINYATYAWLIAAVVPIRHMPPVAVACGSLAGMIVNFSMMKLFVFRKSEKYAVDST